MRSKSLFAICCFIVSFGVQPASAATPVTAMVSYADWCGPCQVLTPKLEEAADAVDVAFIVYLDFTDLSAGNLDRQFERARPLSPDDFMEDRFIKTGFAHVLADGELADTITATMTVTEMKKILKTAAGMD